MIKLKHKIQEMLKAEEAILERELREVTADYAGVVAEHNIRCLKQVLNIKELRNA